jgi:cytochrome d ubiquinol oxidase subunit II
MTLDLPSVWFLILAFEVGLYVILDGADLGIGLLSLLPQKTDGRTLLIHTIGPIWDANETWLVIAGGTLFGAFPLAYSVILNALYIPVFIIIFGLIARAVSFEFRAISARKRGWEFAFGVGSLLAVAGQGLAAGGLLSGIRVVNQQFAGGPFDWCTPITGMVTVGIVMSYVVIGYLYLVKKNDYALEGERFRHVVLAAILTLVAFIGAAILLPSSHYLFFQAWTVEPTRTILWCVSAVIASSSLILLYGILTEKFHRELHTICMVILGLGFIGLLVGIFPYIIPPDITIYDAAASPATLRFMLWGIAPLLPIVLSYNLFMYHVFRGSSAEDRSDEY